MSIPLLTTLPRLLVTAEAAKQVLMRVTSVAVQSCHKANVLTVSGAPGKPRVVTHEKFDATAVDPVQSQQSHPLLDRVYLLNSQNIRVSLDTSQVAWAVPLKVGVVLRPATMLGQYEVCVQYWQTAMAYLVEDPFRGQAKDNVLWMKLIMESMPNFTDGNARIVESTVNPQMVRPGRQPG